MQPKTALTSLLMVATKAALVEAHTTGQIISREGDDLCNNSDFATIFEVRVCQRYNQPKCQAIVYTIQDCSYDRLLYWGCNDDGSGDYDGAGGYYARVDMTPDTTNMSCVNEGLHQLFPGETDFTVEVTACADAEDAKIRERVSMKQVAENQFRCNAVQKFDHVDYKIQVGAPYDANHCAKIESGLVDWCLKGLNQGQLKRWRCSNDGVTMCKDGTVGAYDIRFAMHTGYSACVDEILNEMFQEVLDSTGGFTCNSDTS